MTSSITTSRIVELALIAALACGGAQRSGGGSDFALADTEGRTVRLSDHRGQVVPLNLWATWCVPCAAELPHLQRLYEKYEDRPWLAAAAGYDYTTDPTQPERDYFQGDVSWDITSSSSLRLFAGSARGGLRCVSGVCRVFPPFEGVKLTATLRF